MYEQLIAELPVLRVYKGQPLLNTGKQCSLCLSPYQVNYWFMQFDILNMASFKA
jgi:hypothetical protein